VRLHDLIGAGDVNRPHCFAVGWYQEEISRESFATIEQVAKAG